MSSYCTISCHLSDSWHLGWHCRLRSELWMASWVAATCAGWQNPACASDWHRALVPLQWTSSDSWATGSCCRLRHSWFHQKWSPRSFFCWNSAAPRSVTGEFGFLYAIEHQVGRNTTRGVCGSWTFVMTICIKLVNYLTCICWQNLTTNIKILFSSISFASFPSNTPSILLSSPTASLRLFGVSMLLLMARSTDPNFG